MIKKDFSPTVYKYKNSIMENVENTHLFNSFLKTNKFEIIYNDTLWAEGPCYIPHRDMLIWSDNPNNRILKLENGQVGEFRNPSNFCNGNTLDNEENIISVPMTSVIFFNTEKSMPYCGASTSFILRAFFDRLSYIPSRPVYGNLQLSSQLAMTLTSPQ